MRFRRQLVATACCLLVAGGILAGGIHLLEKVHVWRTRAGERLAVDLATRHGLYFLATMDGPRPVDVVRRQSIRLRGCPSVPGRFGHARRIGLDHDALFRVEPLKLPSHGNVTFAAWFRPTGTARRQRLFNIHSSEDGFVLGLAGGDLVLRVFARSGERRVSCPYAGAPGRMTHVAVVFSPAVAVVYQDGRETMRLALAGPVDFPRRPLLYGRETFWPFEGDIDDLAIWTRGLTPSELNAVAHARVGLVRHYAPSLAARRAAGDALFSALASTCRVIDRLVPSRHTDAALAKEIPLFAAWPSSRDERHFRDAHARSARYGYRTHGAATFRRIDVAYGGKIVPVEVALDNVYANGGARRMAFLARDPSRTLFKGSGVVRVYPPELHATIHPDAPRPLPLSASFIRLYFGNVFRGLYVIEPYERGGSAWFAYGSHRPFDAHTVGYDAPAAPYDRPPPGKDAASAFAETSALVLSDVFFPWSRQEIRFRLRQHAAAQASHDFRHPPKEPSILGDNLSPLFVTDDLDLGGVPGRRWESSDTALVSAAGRVTRPASGAPRLVLLTPVDDRLGPGAPVRVRVVPREPVLQTLFLYVGAPVDKYRDGDFLCYRVPAGGGAGEWLTGLAGMGGGLHHRGNTSYAKGAKRSLALKFDAPVDWVGDGHAARHLLLFSGYADPTRLRNRVSYDAFRAVAANREPSGITSVAWAEVFVNDVYFGVWELAHRVRDILGDEAAPLYKVRALDPPLWESVSPEMAEAIGVPDWRADTARPLEELFARTVGAAWTSFPETACETFSLESLVDYVLLLNFTENHDGKRVNQYLARGRDGRWFVIPWDYDKTFFGRNDYLGNTLLEHCLQDVPGFHARAAGKWRALRAGPLADEALFARLDADAARLAPYMEEEYRLLRPAGWEGDFAGAVSQLKQAVAVRLRLMDDRFR